MGKKVQTILVVDDDIENARSNCEILMHLGFRVITRREVDAALDLLQKGEEFKPADLPSRPRQSLQSSTSASPDTDAPLLPLEEVEMRHIHYALDRLSGNYTQAAKALGISLSTLKRKLK